MIGTIGSFWSNNPSGRVPLYLTRPRRTDRSYFIVRVTDTARLFQRTTRKWNVFVCFGQWLERTMKYFYLNKNNVYRFAAVLFQYCSVLTAATNSSRSEEWRQGEKTTPVWSFSSSAYTRGGASLSWCQPPPTRATTPRDRCPRPASCTSTVWCFTTFELYITWVRRIHNAFAVGVDRAAGKHFAGPARRR